MNQFEEEIYDAPDLPEIKEQVSLIRRIVKKYVAQDGCWYRLYLDNTDVHNSKVMIVFFRVSEETYVWIDSFNSGQLEKYLHSYAGEILYSSSDELVSMVPVVTELISQGKLNLIETSE